MEQIDVIKYQEELKKERIKKLLKNKQALSAAIIGTANIPGALLFKEDFLRAISTFAVGFEIANLRRYWKQEGIREEEQTIEMLRTTTTYQELTEEYNKYIKDIAELIRYVGLNSSKEVVTYLQGLMELGYFTQHMNHQYKKFHYEKDYLVELCGAKIVTGTSVCRHMSSFFADVTNELGYTAASIFCAVNEKDPVKAIQKKNVTINHAVAGIVENGLKFFFDPTNGAFAALPTEFDFTEEESMHVAQFVIPESKKYLIINPNSELLNYGREKECAILNTTKIATISYGEVEYIRNKTEKILQGNMHNQFSFFISHQQQRARIEELYKELLPYSDEKIVQHIVRK